MIAPGEWRLLLTPPAKGAWNMAVDEAILEAAGQEAVPPTLRLYAWSPPCLSLGYAQPVADVDLSRLASYDWELVRRPTGGRAILHTDELTYAVIAPHSEPRLAGSVLESYQRLAAALVEALQRLNIPAQTTEEPKDKGTSSYIPAGSQNPVCFETPSHYEITVNGKKLIGSAQARRREGILQHGSLPLYGDLSRITLALKFDNEASRQASAERLLSRATTVEAVLGRPVEWEAAAQALAESFQQILNLTLQPASLTPVEQARAVELVEKKYANPEWTKRS